MTIKDQILECVRISLPESTATFAKELLNSADRVVRLEKDVAVYQQRLTEYIESNERLSREVNECRNERTVLFNEKTQLKVWENDLRVKENTLQKRLYEVEVRMLNERIVAMERLMEKFVSGPVVHKRTQSSVPVAMPAGGGYVSNFTASTDETSEYL